MTVRFVSPVQIASQHVRELGFEQTGTTEAASVSTSLSASFEDTLASKGADADMDEDRFLCHCILDVKCDLTDADKKPVCSTHCSIDGVVAMPTSMVSEEMEEAARVEFMHANALSMNYSKARAVIEAASVEALCGKVTIPAIMPYEYLKGAPSHPEEPED